MISARWKCFSSVYLPVELSSLQNSNNQKDYLCNLCFKRLALAHSQPIKILLDSCVSCKAGMPSSPTNIRMEFQCIPHASQAQYWYGSGRGYRSALHQLALSGRCQNSLSRSLSVLALSERVHLSTADQ